MKTHTNNFNNKIKEFGRQLNSKITYELEGETIELGIEQLNSVSPHYEGGLLKSVMKQLDIDSNVEIPLGTILKYQFGVKISNSYEYLDFGNYIVYSSEKKEDTNSYKIVCYDKMLYAMKNYESLEITYPITIKNYINAICNKIGLTFKNSNDTFVNYNRQIQNELYLDSNENTLGYTYRDVLDELAEVTASTICINENDDKLEIRYINDTEDTINEEYLKDINVNFGEKYGPINSIVLSRAAESDNVYLQDEESIEENGLCELKIVDNQIMNFNDRSDYLPDILNELDGLEYYINDFSSTGITYYDICDKYNIQIENNIYQCIMLNDEINITQGLEENIHTDMPEESETEYQYASNDDRKINQAYIITKKNEAEIEALASKVVDISDEVSGIGSITLENAYEGILHQLSIKGQLNLLFPQSNNNLYGYPLTPTEDLKPKADLMPSSPVFYQNEIIYPSSELYTKDFILLIDEIEYKLDIDFLNYISNTVCDEFIYEDGECWIVRRVGVNSNGEKYALDDEVVERRESITLYVKQNSTIQLKAFNNTIISSTYLLQNDYTNTFANQVEVSSELNLLADTLEAKVSQVADDDGNVTSASIILAVNNDSSEAIIEADKINLNGVVTANENFKILEDGSMETKNATFSGTINGGAIEITGNFTEQDPYIHIEHPNSTSQAPIGSNMWSNGISCWDYSGGVPVIRTETSDGFAELSGNVVNAYGFNNVSLREEKKNFETLKNGINIIKGTDIYKYNYKGEDDKNKKHIGVVIDKTRKSNTTPDEIIADNGKGVDLYSMISVSWKAIQEQQEIIEQLQEEIEKLKKEMSK